MGVGPSVQPMSRKWGVGAMPGIIFLATLNLPNLSKLMNNSVVHLPHGPPIPTKMPSDIPKFEGKIGENTLNHIMTFHLWCSLNSLSNNNI